LELESTPFLQEYEIPNASRINSVFLITMFLKDAFLYQSESMIMYMHWFVVLKKYRIVVINSVNPALIKKSTLNDNIKSAFICEYQTLKPI
tara:strand:+ start:59601 stop:59873 length:273 start_codon:yes stop_codon:yes gene_type:complete